MARRRKKKKEEKERRKREEERDTISRGSGVESEVVSVEDGHLARLEGPKGGIEGLVVTGVDCGGQVCCVGHDGGCLHNE